MWLVWLVVLLLFVGDNFLVQNCCVHLGHPVHCARTCPYLPRVCVRLLVLHCIPAAVVILHTMWGMWVECMLGAAWLRMLTPVAICRIVVVVVEVEVVVVVVASTACCLSLFVSA